MIKYIREMKNAFVGTGLRPVSTVYGRSVSEIGRSDIGHTVVRIFILFSRLSSFMCQDMNCLLLSLKESKKKKRTALFLFNTLLLYQCQMEFSLKQRPYFEKDRQKGRISFQYRFTGKDSEKSIEMALNEKLIQPELIPFPTFFFMPLLYHPDHLVSLEKSFEVHGDAVLNKEYIIEIPQGEYFSSIRISNRSLISFGYISKPLNREEFSGDFRFIEYAGSECKYYKKSISSLYCPKVKVFSDQAAKIRISESPAPNPKLSVSVEYE